MTRPVDLKPGDLKSGDLTSHDLPPARDLVRARLATLGAFFASGAVYAGWGPQIPPVKLPLGPGHFAAAGGCGLLLAAGLSAEVTALAIALAMGVALVACRGWLLPGKAERTAQAPAASWRPTGLLLALAALAFAALLAEEAMTDWSTVFLRFARDLSEAAAAGGYAGYAAAMAVGRLLGDRLVQGLGPARLVLAGALIAAAGLAAAIALP